MFVWLGAIAVVVGTVLWFWGGSGGDSVRRVAAGLGFLTVAWTLFVAIIFASPDLRTIQLDVWVVGMVAVLAFSGVRLWRAARKPMVGH
jgi:hypothetical protein